MDRTVTVGLDQSTRTELCEQFVDVLRHHDNRLAVRAISLMARQDQHVSRPFQDCNAWIAHVVALEDGKVEDLRVEVQ